MLQSSLSSSLASETDQKNHKFEVNSNFEVLLLHGCVVTYIEIGECVRNDQSKINYELTQTQFEIKPQLYL